MLITTATHSPRISASHRPIRLGIGILLLFCAVPPARGADPDASMEPVIRVARANYERIKTLDISWTEDNHPNNGPLFPPSLLRLTEDFPTGRYRYEERRTFYDDRKDDNPSIEAFNGKVRTAYPWRDYSGPTMCAGYIKRVAASGVDAQPQVNGAGGVCKACAPVDFPFPPRFLEYLTECKARPGSETAGWRNCVVADHFCNGMIDGRIWLDVERGAMPVREVVYHQPPGTFYYGPSLPEAGLESVSGATEAHQFTDSKGISVWLPTKMKQSDTDGTYTEEVDIAHTRLNPAIDPRQFRVTFPPGAPVFNPATGYFLTTDPNDPSIDDTLPLAPPATHPDAPAN